MIYLHWTQRAEMISGLVVKYLNGERFIIRRGYKTTLHGSSSFYLTVPKWHFWLKWFWTNAWM